MVYCDKKDCHSDDRREEESRKYKGNDTEIFRFALNDKINCFLIINKPNYKELRYLR